MPELDLAAHLRATTEWACKNLVNDLNALDEEKAATSLDAGSRPAIKMVAECGAVNGMLASLIYDRRRLPMPTPEQREAFYAAITTRSDALSRRWRRGRRSSMRPLTGWPTDQWGEIVQTPFGPWTKARAASLAAQHVMYHDGQLNSLHLRHGDTEMHWG